MSAIETARRLCNKFVVERIDGQSAEGRKHHGCMYFPLDVTHDLHAIPALEAYAQSCQEQWPRLASDLRALVNEAKIKAVVRSTRKRNSMSALETARRLKEIEDHPTAADVPALLELVRELVRRGDALDASDEICKDSQCPCQYDPALAEWRELADAVRKGEGDAN